MTSSHKTSAQGVEQFGSTMHAALPSHQGAHTTTLDFPASLGKARPWLEAEEPALGSNPSSLRPLAIGDIRIPSLAGLASAAESMNTS